MKNIFLFAALASLTLFGCDQPATTLSATTVDTVSHPKKSDPSRPADEMILVKKLWDADAIINKQANDVGKQAVVDSTRADISNYLTNTLNAKANNWIAYVGDMQVIGSKIFLSLLIPKNWNLDNNSHPDFTAVNLKVYLNADADKTVVNMLKSLTKGDRVTISGEFVKLNKKVDIEPSQLIADEGTSSIYSIFEEPWYPFTLTDIKPYANK